MIKPLPHQHPAGPADMASRITLLQFEIATAMGIALALLRSRGDAVAAAEIEREIAEAVNGAGRALDLDRRQKAARSAA